MSEMQQNLSVVVRRVLDAPIELVYRAWTEPEHVRHWMKCDPKAEMRVDAWEPRPGGAIRYQMAMPGVWACTSTGTVIEALPPHRFAYTLDPDPSLGAPALTVRIELATIDGGTKLTLTHSGLPTTDFCGTVEAGWTVSLGLLADFVAHEAQPEARP